MAGEYYYYSSNHNDNDNYNYNSSDQSTPPLPLHLCFFLSIMFLFLGLSWYMSYESVVESLFDQIKMVVMLLPVVLLLAVHVLSENGWASFFVALPERESLHRAGGSPWGVALVLVVLIFMVSYKSSFDEKWFPLISR